MRRETIAFLLIVAMLGFGSGCGARGAYNVLQLHQDQRCLDLQGADQNECLRQDKMSYDEYQRQLKDREQER